MADRQVIDFLEKYDRYIIIGHREPDGDCIGSQLALSSFLERNGKKTSLLSPGPFLRPEIAEKACLFKTEWETPSEQSAAVIIVDCSTLDRIGPFADPVAEYPILVIDHHSAGRSFGTVRYIDSAFPSVTLMIYSIIREMGAVPGKEEAELLFFGFSTDTGFYRHLESSGAPYLKLVTELIEAGASPKKAFHEMYGNRSFMSRKLIGIVLSRIESYESGQVICTWLSRKDRQENGNEQLESDTLYQLLQGIAGSEVIVLIREEDEENQLSVGLRSLSRVDVGKLAGEFGGGGHARAAGFSHFGSISEARTMILEKISPLV